MNYMILSGVSKEASGSGAAYMLYGTRGGLWMEDLDKDNGLPT